MNERITYEYWMQLGHSEDEAKELEALSTCMDEICPISDEDIEELIAKVEGRLDGNRNNA